MTEGSGIPVRLPQPLQTTETTMKKILFVAAACLLAAACSPTDGESTTASLEVSPSSLAFGAEDTTPQEITVTATGVEWEYTVPSSADWITVDDGTAGKLLVSVAKNPTAEKRTASIAVKPVNNDDVKAKSVTVTQAGSETPEVYSLTVDPAALTFEAEGAAGQSVKVTASGEGITWSAAVDEAAKEWITLSTTEGSEGETTLTVTVQDNPDTAERSANVTLTPSAESVGPKAIRVTQEAKVLPPSFSMSYNGGEIPEEGFTIHYKGETSYDVDVVPVNVEWNVKVEYEAGGSGWLEANKVESENVNKIHIACNLDKRENTSSDPRTARVVVTTNVEDIGPFEIPVMQEGKPEFLSTLEEDVDFGVLTQSRVLVYPNNDYREMPYTEWDFILWDEGISYDGVNVFTGSGDKMCLKVAGEVLTQNDDNEYYLADGTYTVVANFDSGTITPEIGQISGGAFGYSHPLFPNGSWYIRMQDDAVTGDACIKEGTMTVARSGETYTLTFDFTSDAGYKVTGSFEGALNVRAQ